MKYKVWFTCESIIEADNPNEAIRKFKQSKLDVKVKCNLIRENLKGLRKPNGLKKVKEKYNLNN